MKAATTHQPTIAERLVRTVVEAAADSGGDLAGGDLTHDGVRAIVAQLRTALPYVPRIIIGGAALNCMDRIVEKALAAMVSRAVREGQHDLAEAPDAERAEALYLLGLLVGAELAGGAR